MNDKELKKLPLNKKIGLGYRLYFKRTSREVGNWTFRYERYGQKREMGLGSYPAISRKKAFELRDKFNIQLDCQEDPYEKRRATKLITAERENIRFSDNK